MPANVVDGLQINIIGNVTPFATAMDKAEAIAKRQAKAIKQAIDKEITESNHSLALFGEAFGVGIPRHIRTLVSELPGVSKAMSAAFDGLAGLVLIKVIAEAVEKVKELAEAWHKSQEFNEKFVEGAKAVLRPLQDNNDALAVTKDKLEDAIRKLSGKPPSNGIKLAIDEAIVSADKLHSSLQKSLGDIGKYLKDNSVGILKQISGTAGTGDISKGFEDFQKKMSEADEEHKDNLEKLNKADAKGLRRENERYREEIHEINKKYEADLKKLNDDTQAQQKLHNQGPRVVGQNPITGDDIIERTADQTARLMAIGTANQGRKDNIRGFDLQNDVGDLTAKQEHLAAAKPGDDAFKRKMDELRKEHESLIAEMSKLGFKDTLDSFKGEKQEQSGTIQRDTENRTEWIKAVAEGNAIAQKNADALAEETISYRLSSGAITQQEAAFQRASLHASTYQRNLSDLQAELKAIADNKNLSPNEKQLQSQNVQNRIDQLNGSQSITAMQDRLAMAATAASRGMTEFFTEFRQQATNSAATVKTALSTTINGVNDQLANAITGKKTNFAQVFESAGQGLVKSGLERSESALFSKLGFGKLGTLTNPMIVKSVDGVVGGAVKGAGGIFSKIFGGFFADGGSPDPYRASIVGERGPELFIPQGVSGKVISNRDLAGAFGGGSGVNITNNIDARDTNAAEVDRRVQRGSMLAYQQAMVDSRTQRTERNARIPAHARD